MPADKYVHQSNSSFVTVNTNIEFTEIRRKAECLAKKQWVIEEGKEKSFVVWHISHGHQPVRSMRPNCPGCLPCS
jgi:hypothetical protein